MDLSSVALHCLAVGTCLCADAKHKLRLIKCSFNSHNSWLPMKGACFDKGDIFILPGPKSELRVTAAK